mmetsp:Transcript_13037/g.39400  ORF Transcript_13037/g.39400 Transcript_13037/m.39400 type:complete len:943 (+) Transcript_13037:492-3320(+)
MNEKHTFVESSPVVPLADASLLFTNAGMNQFKTIFLGTVEPSQSLAKLKRACNSQKCIRAGGKHNDLEDVGVDTYHHTFFEMLGSWSFGDYFKRDAITWAYDLLVNVYGLDPERMYATYFGGDEAEGLEPDLEAKELWLQVLPASRVLPGSKRDNFWEMGESGPCGACSEIHYDCDLSRHVEVPELVNADDPTVLELWNLVFVEYDRDAKTQKLSPLPAKHVDTGMGLERLVAVLNGKTSNYDTDAFGPLFDGIFDVIRDNNKGRYGGLVGSRDVALRDTAYRAVADHLRCLSFAIADGAVPSHEGRGYVLRRVLRRAVRYGRQILGVQRKTFMADLAPLLSDSRFGDAYPELRAQKDKIVSVLKDEELAFGKTLERGVKYLDEAMQNLDDDDDARLLSGDAAFFLYDSLGFPLDLTQLMASERGVGVDADGFAAAMAAQVARSRADRSSQKKGGVDFVLSANHVAALEARGVAPTRSLSHSSEEISEATVVAVFAADDGTFVEVPEASGTIGVVLDSTPFYAEGGGQVADTGTITVGDSTCAVRDVQAFGGYLLHACDATGAVKAPSDARASVDAERRSKIAPNHSMTHVVNHALRDVLGAGVDQKGSLVDDQKLRFDFSHAKALTPAEIRAVEQRVNAVIDADLQVDAQYVPLQRAMTGIESLRAVFGEAYPDPVRVVAAGCRVEEVLAAPERADEWRQFSIELCGGTHVRSTGEAERFAITEETAVAKGVRRLEAVTRDAALEAVRQGDLLTAKVADLADRLDSDVDGVAEAAKGVRAELDASTAPAALKPELRSQLDALGKRVGHAQKQRRATALAAANDLLKAAADDARSQNLAAFVVLLPPGVDPKAAATMASKVRDLSFFAVSPDANDEHKSFCFASQADDPASLNANVWLKAALDPLGGRGGGKPSFAQGSAAGCDPAALVDAAQAALDSSSSS